jgi:ubiquinone/menaquinone biosynthesis C-methylase UbiE
MGFDPAQYKTAIRQQWEDGAEAWDRWGPTLEAWLGEATDRMLEVAGVRAGAEVLDVAAGAGGQTLAAARRVGPPAGWWRPTSRRPSCPSRPGAPRGPG